jgi:hypothetical protein
MSQMKLISELETLFFQAERTFLNPPKQYFVKAYPYNKHEDAFYKGKDNEFDFRTYKEVIVAGILWTKKLFGINSIQDLYIEHLEIGRSKKRFFNTQLVQTGNGIIIDGEKFNPYVNIEFSYDYPTAIKFDIGFYRFACKNGVVHDLTKIVDLKIKPASLFEIPIWINPCLITNLSKRYEEQIKILKNTSIHRLELQNWIDRNLSKWGVDSGVVSNNITELGDNAYALFNIVTFLASNIETEMTQRLPEALIENYSQDLEIEHSESNRAKKQRRAGVFLEELIEAIKKDNIVYNSFPDINSPEFLLDDTHINTLGNTYNDNKYNLEIGKFKFKPFN